MKMENTLLKMPSLQSKLPIFRIFLTVAFMLVIAVVYLSYFHELKSNLISPQPHLEAGLKSKSYKSGVQSPWKNVPDFDLFLRMSSRERHVTEYKMWFVQSYKYFWPPERIDSLILVLDDEVAKDHEVGKTLQSTWPFPPICYRKPLKNRGIYHGNERMRMYWDGFFPETCTSATYVGYVDSDTVWSSLVTPNSPFEDGKPIVLPRIGQHTWTCWAVVTEFVLGYKEVPQCMSYFPVMIKVSHIIEVREFIEKKHKRPFNEVCRESFIVGKGDCMCQYSIFCNYVWYHYRDEYRFHMQMIPDENWDGKYMFVPVMASLSYLKNNVPLRDKIPKPRIAIHGRHLFNFDTWNSSKIYNDGYKTSSRIFHAAQYTSPWLMLQWRL